MLTRHIDLLHWLKSRLLSTSGPVMIALFLLVVASCDSVKKDDEDEEGDDGSSTEAATLNFDVSTAGNGRTSVTFDVPDGTNKIGIVAEATEFVEFQSIFNDAGDEYLFSGTTFATEALPFVNYANIPSRDFETGIDSELRYTAIAQVFRGGRAAGGAPVHVTVHTKNDGSLSSGRLNVNVFYVGSVANSAELRQVTESALELMRSIYSDQASISLNVSFFDVGGPNSLPNPSFGDGFYSSASRLTTGLGVNVFIGQDVDVNFGQTDVLGIASSIPGPPSPSPRSAVAVSMINSAGADGRFNDDEIRLLGETMAHEVGHFMGLFHPVEIDQRSGSVGGEDPLPDTATCNIMLECLGNDSLVQNLMFPFPVSDGEGSTVAQNSLTGQQAGVMNLYIATD